MCTNTLTCIQHSASHALAPRESLIRITTTSLSSKVNKHFDMCTNTLTCVQTLCVQVVSQNSALLAPLCVDAVPTLPLLLQLILRIKRARVCRCSTSGTFQAAAQTSAISRCKLVTSNPNPNPPPPPPPPPPPTPNPSPCLPRL